MLPGGRRAGSGERFLRPLCSASRLILGGMAGSGHWSGSPLSGGDVVVDLLFASSGIEPEVVQAAEITEVVPGLRLPIAITGHLIALKLLARDDQERPQDLADLRELHAVATSADYQAAQEAVKLISARGFNRGRDLTAALRQLEPSPGATMGELQAEA